MSRDLGQLLRDTAAQPGGPSDPAALVRRGLRRRRRRQGAVAVTGAVAVALVGVVALQLLPTPTPEVVDEPPTESAAPSPQPSPSPTTATSPAPTTASAEPSTPLLDRLRSNRAVVVHDGGTWVRMLGGPWERLGDADDVQVVGEGRWWYERSDPGRTLRSVDVPSPDLTCPTPTGAFTSDAGYDTTVVHEDELTTVFVTASDGTVASVVCEDPGAASPIADWRPPTAGDEAGFGPFITVDDGVRLVSYADAEGNLTVYDGSESRVLIEHAISGPFVDGDRGLLVHVAQDGGMHIAGGTLVVSDLDGDELRRVDLRGTSQLVGLVDGVAVVERVQLPDLTPTALLLIDITTGTVVEEAETDVEVLHVGPDESTGFASVAGFLNRELARLLAAAELGTLGGDHDIGVATEIVRVPTDGPDVELSLALYLHEDAERLGVADGLDVTETQDGGGASVSLGTWPEGGAGAVLACPHRALLLYADDDGPGAEAVRTAAERIAAVWACTGFDGGHDAATCPDVRPRELPSGAPIGSPRTIRTDGGPGTAWGSGSDEVVLVRNEVAWSFAGGRDDFHRSDLEPVTGPDGTARRLIVIGHGEGGQVQIRFSVEGCDHILFVTMSHEDSQAYAARF